MWDSIIKPALVLFLVCAVTTGALAVVNRATVDVIEQRTNAEQEEFRKQVLDNADSFKQIELGSGNEAVKNVYAGYRDGELEGYVVNITAKGYGGDIGMIVGVDKNGTVTGVIIGDNEETPGLGTKVFEPDFINQFEQVGVNDELTVVKQNRKSTNEIQAVSGATITSRGVTQGVQAALDITKKLMEEGN
ncbi:MAG TPA: electron transporter RnfG [Ruminiclostridium sp.]|jgi:electron transport complex protein RnfG|nr:RnfABCDGE type electron transport complex subunit G [Clostridiaceae bacterium]HAA26013.1 electron transporter RnfG [Ruminiclostridium sp.]